MRGLHAQHVEEGMWGNVGGFVPQGSRQAQGSKCASKSEGARLAGGIR